MSKNGMVPRAGIEPALLSEPDFESGASTNSAKGATLESHSLVCGGLYEPTIQGQPIFIKNAISQHFASRTHGRLNKNLQAVEDWIRGIGEVILEKRRVLHRFSPDQVLQKSSAQCERQTMARKVLAENQRRMSAILVTAGMIFTVGSALGFQHIGGYTPCALCLLQRDPYYYAIPVGILAIAASIFKLPVWLTRSALLLVGIAMLIGVGLGVYHSGVEWGFWPGPITCATSAPSITTNAGNLLSDLNAIKAPSCNDAALRVLGLSFAGWNVIASVVLAAIAFFGATRPSNQG